MKVKLTLIAATTFLSLGWLLCFFRAMPAPQVEDSVGFLPQIFEVSNGGKLRNPFFNAVLAARTGTEGQRLWNDGKVTWHGFLMPMVAGHLVKNATYADIYMIIGAFDCLTLILIVALAARTFVGRVPIVALAAAPPAVASWIVGSTERPEWFGLFLVSVGMAICARLRGTGRLLAAGGFCGLCAAASPQTGIMALAISCSLLALEADDFRGCVLTFALIGASALAALALAVLWYPYTLGEWVDGLREHAGLVARRHDAIPLKLRAVFLFIHLYRPGFIFWVAGGLAGLVILAQERLRQRGAWALKIGVIAATVAYGVYACRRLLAYNATPFFGLLLMSSLFALEKSTGRGRRILTTSFCLLCVLSSPPLVMQTLIPRIQSAVTYGEARAQLIALKQKYQTLTISPGLIPLLSDHRGVDVIPDGRVLDRNFIGDGRILVVQQAFLIKKTPPTYAQYSLLTSSFSGQGIQVGKFMILRTPWGWNSAVYLKKPHAAEAAPAAP